MNRPDNKLVDGKTLRHVLILLKGIMESEGKLPDGGLTIKNTDSEEVKELVYTIIYGLEESKPSDEDIVEKDIPLVSYLTKYINKHVIEAIESGSIKIDFASEEDILGIFERKAAYLAKYE